MNLVIYTDGASRSNPGHAAIGYWITNGKRTLEAKGEYIGVTTNNEAEYRALVRALKEAAKYEADEVKCYSDSNLMVHQVKGEWKIKAQQLQDYYNDVKRLEKAFKKVTYHHVRRDNPGVEKCDALANQALDRNIYK